MTSDDVELRVLTADDWEAWRLIRLEALAEAPEAFGSRLADWQDAPAERWRARLAMEGSRNFVAYEAGTPVGMATGIPGEEPHAVGVISMFVPRSARGTGVAGLLLDAVESWGRTEGARSMCLDVVATNARARRLYERHGLVVVGEVDRESPEDPLELRMCKSLG